MTDEVTDNVQETPVEAPAATATTEVPASADTTAAAGSTVEEQLQAEREARQKAEKSYAELRSLNDRRFNQVQQELQRLRTQNPPDPEQAAAEREAQRLAALEERQAITDFKVSHPDHGEMWPEVIRYTQENPHQVVARRDDGSIDYSASLDNAYARVKLRQYEQQQEKRRQAAEAAETQRTQNKAQAVISGGTVAPPEMPPDIANMTADEMVLKGLIQYDENDPPSIIRKKRQGLVK